MNSPLRYQICRIDKNIQVDVYIAVRKAESLLPELFREGGVRFEGRLESKPDGHLSKGRNK